VYQTFVVRTGDPFVVVEERDQEFLGRCSILKYLNLGADMGIVSYAETPLKGIVAAGVTTISTDFAQMETSMAEMMLSH
jgi:DNA-binding LacI/PurR family transcriptional regulator